MSFPYAPNASKNLNLARLQRMYSVLSPASIWLWFESFWWLSANFDVFQFHWKNELLLNLAIFVIIEVICFGSQSWHQKTLVFHLFNKEILFYNSLNLNCGPIVFHAVLFANESWKLSFFRTSEKICHCEIFYHDTQVDQAIGIFCYKSDLSFPINCWCLGWLTFFWKRRNYRLFLIKS